MKLYTDLAHWWPLLSAPEDYEEEVRQHWQAILSHTLRPVDTLLELGCGGGNNAFHLKQHCRLTLTDVSMPMLEVSQALNPECQHIMGDMRKLRLGREFDAVFVHDAIMYMRCEGDLRAAMETAFVHCRPGGVALFVPDCTRESFEPGTSAGGHDGRGRALRYFEWVWDPDPTDSQYNVEMVYLLRDGHVMNCEFERHALGLFARQTWLELLREVGFRATVGACSYVGGERAAAFIGVRPE